jgi:hypothetical protein
MFYTDPAVFFLVFTSETSLFHLYGKLFWQYQFYSSNLVISNKRLLILNSNYHGKSFKESSNKDK